MILKRPRHGIRKRGALLWGFAMFAIVQFVSGLLLDYCWPLLRFPEAARRLSIQHTGANAPDILCLGSSRFEGEIVPEEIARLLQRQLHREQPVKVFNGSVAAGEPIAMEFMFDELFKQGARPLTVVLEVNPDTLN